MKSSFKDFVIEHLWLFAVCILFPVVVIDLFCYFNNYDLEQGTVATIVIGVLTYIGTILWGMFIYYKSWLDKKMQEYRDRPRVDIKYLPKSDPLRPHAGRGHLHPLVRRYPV